MTFTPEDEARVISHADQAAMSNPNEAILEKLLQLIQDGEAGPASFRPTDTQALVLFARQQTAAAIRLGQGQSIENLGWLLLLQGFTLGHEYVKKYGPLETGP